MADGIALDESWIAAMAAASSDLTPAQDRSAIVAVTIGKKQQAVLEMVDGRVISAGDAEAASVTVPVTGAQLAAFTDGTESMARSYMMGDIKPVGSTGALLPLIELFENAEFRDRLQAELSSV